MLVVSATHPKTVTPYELEQRETDEPSVVLIELAGELDLTNARELEGRIEAFPGENGRSLLIDLNRVVFMDSAALHVLFRTARRLGRDRFGLLYEPTAAVSRTLGIVGLPTVATSGALRDELIAALSAS
jgi:anti-anti-sigma factor